MAHPNTLNDTPRPSRTRSASAPKSHHPRGLTPTHTHDDVCQWLDNHPRFHLHFTPTSSSWINLVERWFRALTDKALRRGIFQSVPDLVTSIQEYIDAHNNDPRPYLRTATAESILSKVARGRIAL